MKRPRNNQFNKDTSLTHPLTFINTLMQILSKFEYFQPNKTRQIIRNTCIHQAKNGTQDLGHSFAQIRTSKPVNNIYVLAKELLYDPRDCSHKVPQFITVCMVPLHSWL